MPEEGRSVEQLLQRKRELLAQKKEKLILQRSIMTENDNMDIGDARISALTQGLTAGFGDEIAAAGKGALSYLTTPGTPEQRSEAFGLERDRSMAASELKRNALREQYPKTTMGFGGLGGMGSGGALFKAAKPIVGKLPYIQQLMGTGAVEGGLYGAGTAQPGERLGDAVMGAVVGALATPFVAAVGVQGMKILRPIAKRLGEALFGQPRDRAVKEVVAALDAEDISIDEAFTLLRAMGRNATIADLGDAPGRLGRVVTSELGGGASQARRFLDARQLTQQMELRQVARRATGASDYEKGINEIINSAESKAAPIYREVESQVLDVTPAMLDFMQRPAFKSARAQAATMLRNEGFATDIVDDVTDVRYMDAVKRALDDQIGTAYRGGNDNQARILRNLKNDFVAEIDRQVPRYAEARSVFAGEAAIKEASEFGRTMFVGNKFSARDASEVIAGMGESELRAARVGFLDWMADELSRTSVKRNTMANKFADVPKFKEMITDLFPNQNAVDDFLREASAQAQFARTKNLVTGGPATARIQSDRGGLSPGLLRVTGDAAFSQIGGLSSALALIRGNTRLTPEVLKEMGKILFDPKVVPRQLKSNPFMVPFNLPQASRPTSAGMAGGFTAPISQGVIEPLQQMGLLGGE